VSAELVLEGRAWCVGDDVQGDADMLPPHLSLSRSLDPTGFVPHLFHQLLPEFGSHARAGDVVFTGRNFLAGKFHAPALLALRSVGVGLVVASVRSVGLRRLVNTGIPVLVGSGGDTWPVSTGDPVRVDFGAGRVQVGSGEPFTVAPLDAYLVEMVRAGGLEELVARDVAAGEVRR
jgi:3-isopropylmalate dehydratase small subunit